MCAKWASLIQSILINTVLAFQNLYALRIPILNLSYSLVLICVDSTNCNGAVYLYPAEMVTDELPSTLFQKAMF